MALFNSFKFGDVDSKDYGIYISGDSVYNSPARSVDLVQVPGRNGALALDNGYYENIEVTYPAGSFGASQEEWREKMLGIRNALAAQRGYQKLVDTYHPDHYRLGMFLAGISASPVQYNRAGQFPIRFNCKPQRFLTSGDTPVEFNASEQEESYGPSDIVSFEGVNGTAVTDLKVNIEPIQSGTGDPSPTNIRPITGHTEVNVVRSGANMLTMDASKWGLYGTTESGWGNNVQRFAPYGQTIPFEAGKSYTIDVYNGMGVNKTFYVGVSEYNPSTTRIVDHGWKAVPYTFTVNANTTVIRMGFRDNTYSNCADYVAAIGTKLFVTMTEEAAATYPTTLGQTVYGGTLNVTTGVLTVDRALVDIGTLGWNGIDGLFNALISTALTPSNNIYCSQYKTVAATTPSGSMPDYSVKSYGNASSKLFYIRDGRYSDAATFKTAMSGVQLCYELSTPTTVQLTPTQVSTLLGQNHIFADSGTVEVTLAQPTQFENPTNFPAKPNIRVYGNGTVRVGDTIATVQNNADYIDIDCEAMNCTDGSTNRNSDVSFSGNDFPVLESGANSILLNGPSKVEITPRWWEL